MESISCSAKRMTTVKAKKTPRTKKMKKKSKTRTRMKQAQRKILATSMQMRKMTTMMMKSLNPENFL
jgi:hypothetical protein